MGGLTPVRFVIAEQNCKSKMLQRAKPEPEAFGAAKKSHLQVQESSFGNETKSRDFRARFKPKKAKRDQISVDSMIALYILKPAAKLGVEHIGGR